jgi:hypothetical protein
MTMALRDEIQPKLNKVAGLEKWLDDQPNGEEWYQIIYDLQYSHLAVAKLLTKHGFACDHNVIARFRQKHVA